MDFSNSIRKSFKSHGSYKHSRRISAGEADDSHHEQLPILSDHAMRTSLDLSDHPEVIVKIDGGDQSTSKKNDNSSSGSNIWLESSYEFWKDGDNGGGGGFKFPVAAAGGEDPPSRLISQFLSRQRNSGSEMSLDVDLEMDGIDRDQNPRSLPPIAETPRILDDNNRVASSKEAKVSFEPDIVEKRRGDSSFDDEMDEVRPQQYHNRRRSSNISFVAENNNDVNDNGGGGGEVLKCSSFQRRASMLRTKTKSRFDTPEYPEWRSGKSGPIRSGMLGLASGMLGKNGDEDEEDPWFDDDVPEDFKKGNLNALTLVQWISLLVIVAALACTLALPRRPPAGGASIQYSRALSKKQEEGIPIDHLHKWNPKNISAWNMKRLMNMVRHGSLSTLDERILDSKKEDESAKQIRSEYEAKVAARKIFFNVAEDKSKYIFLHDLMRFLREEEAMKTMNLIEGSSESEKISNFVDSKKDHWYSSPMIVLMNLEDLNKLKFSVWLRHRINHQDMGTKWSRRALVVEEMVRVFKELDIEYRLYPLNINVRTMPDANSTGLPSTWADSA
ncbi:hypothetical protein RJ639_005304 [Escallonia herrerae]|uniref:Uncharacterized protein n=1 Tax=Escallonia herrerae TaxID=1293975 RepID=A0AA88VW51_9ASTE|nr:hypothetical protein RJ639_005304 [Escallonia herrerae]